MSEFKLPISGREPAQRMQIGPYPLLEGLGLVMRNLLGPSLANPAGIAFAASGQVCNTIEPVLTLGVGGDVMMMFGRDWQIDSSLRDFFTPCDRVLLNMEGVITEQPKRGPDQKHDARIIPALAQLSDPSKTWLSLANNHSADFGHADCLSSMRQFEQAGYRCFGLQDSPYADLHPALRVVAATQWSNRPSQDLYWLDQTPEQHRRTDCFNLLFPHWSYEMACYPRLPAVAQMQQWLTQFDAVVGHHSHTPQPIALHTVQDARQQLAAYSLGDLCFGLGFKNWPALKHYPYGIVARVEIGRLTADPSRWAIGRLDWSFVDCAASADKRSFTSKLVGEIPYFR